MNVTKQHVETFKAAFYTNTADETADPVEIALKALFAQFPTTPLQSVSREEALDFLGTAARNWRRLPPLSEDDIGDVATALLWFCRKRTSPLQAVVEPLSWITMDSGEAWSRSVPVGLQYHATPEGWRHRNGGLNVVKGVEAAKVAAQADYEARILSALMPSPAPNVQVPTAKMLLAGSMVDWKKYDDKAEAALDVWNAMLRNAPAPAPKKRDKPALNHDLLERALPIVVNEAICTIEGCSEIRANSDDFEPVPGTCDPEQIARVEDLLDLIREVEAEIGPTAEPEPQWFEGLLDKRWSLGAATAAEGSADV